MKSKISFFSPAIFRKDLLRFWPFWVLELAGLQLLVVIPLFSELSAGAQTRNRNGMRDIVYLVGNRGPCLTDSILISCLCICAATLIFSYLTKAKESYAIHSFPMRRATLFFSHYLAGLVMLFVPFMVTYLEVIFVMGGFGPACTEMFLGKMAVTLIEVFLFYHLSCMVVMLTANSFMSVVVFTVLNVLYAGLMYLFSALGTLFIYGYPSDLDLTANHMARWLTPAVTMCSFLTRLQYLFFQELPGEGWIDTASGEFTGEQLDALDSIWGAISLDQAVWYLVPAAVFFVLALVLYRRRPVESAGDVVAFSWGKPVFRLVFTVCGSVLFVLSVYMLCIKDNGVNYTFHQIFPVLLLLLALGCILFYLVSNMILWRSFFIWKRTSYVRMALVAAAAVGIMCYMKFGGYGTRIPDLEQVQMMSLDYERFTQNKQLIQQFMKLQEEMIRNGEQVPVAGYDENMEEVYVEYTLKGGSKVQRSYPLQKGRPEYVRYLDFINNKETVCSLLFTEDYDKITPQLMLMEFMVPDDRDVNTYNCVDISDTEQKKRLYQAILADLQMGNMIPQYTTFDGGEDAVEIQIGIKIPQSVCKAGNYSGIYRQTMEENPIRVWMTRESENTRKVIREDDSLKRKLYKMKAIL